ncbi:MAG: signal transduction histidine kinase [Cyclobacteriaceae bacterium]|jgi:signal transduction histidine kinase
MSYFLTVFLVLLSLTSSGQNTAVTLSTEMFSSHERLFLAELEGWIFKEGHDASWSELQLEEGEWGSLRPNQLTAEMEDVTGRVEGWFRLRIKLDQSFEGMPLTISRTHWAATDVYIDGELVHSFGDTGTPYQAYNPTLKDPIPIELEIGKVYLLAVHFVDYETTFTQRELRLNPFNLQSLINLNGPAYIERVKEDIKLTHIYGTLTISASFLLFVLFCLLVFLNPTQKTFKFIAALSGIMLITAIGISYHTFYEQSYDLEKLRFLVVITMQPLSTLFGLLILEWVLTKHVSVTSIVIFVLILITNLLAHLFSISLPFGITFTAMILHFGRIAYLHRNDIRGANLAVVAAAVVPTFAALIYINIHKYSLDLFYEYDKPLTSLLTLSGPIFLLIYISIRFKEVLNEAAEEAQKVLTVTEEKRELLANQNVLLEKQVEERTIDLNRSLEDLKSTQSQLIHSEKLASLGELTAGIAHEIQNPLNFVNNFSDLNKELLDELKDAVAKNDQEEVDALIKDLGDNESKINRHGRRAEAIVKSMLQHSRTGSGEKELTDINLLADEYLRLSYHGLRAKIAGFNADFKTDLDPDLPKINVVPQDIGRVLLNLINNAFQAVHEKSMKAESRYKPTVTLTTELTANGQLQIAIIDNGPGIPDSIKDKIFQPFFTTKPTGEGTGLGLSMSYDIVTKGHGGDLKVNTLKEEGSEFIIYLPTNK